MNKKVVEFLPWQQRAIVDDAFILLLAGAAGTGKSFMAAHKLHFMAERYPKSNLLMVRKSKSSMVNSTVLFYERFVIEGNPNVKHVPSKSRFAYSNGSSVFYGGLMNTDQREQLRSIGADGSIDMIWMEEATALSEYDYEELLTRLRGKNTPYNQVILSTNPSGYSHWINKRLILGGQAKVYAPGFGVNPHNSEGYSLVMSSLTGARHKRMVGGKWVSEQGAVYADFDERTHVIESFEIPQEWARYRTIDFGYKNPAVCLWAALAPSGQLYVYQQLYMSLLRAEAFAKLINQYSFDESYRATVADWDAGDRAELDKHGIPTVTAQKDVRTGINQVRQRLLLGNGDPGILIFNDSLIEPDARMKSMKRPTDLQTEFPEYRWLEDKDLQNKNQQELPVAVNDHALDALRYLVMLLFYNGEVGYGSMNDILDNSGTIDNSGIDEDIWLNDTEFLDGS